MTANTPSGVYVAESAVTIGGGGDGGRADTDANKYTDARPECSGKRSGSTYSIRTAEWIPSHDVDPDQLLATARVMVPFDVCYLLYSLPYRPSWYSSRKPL